MFASWQIILKLDNQVQLLVNTETAIWPHDDRRFPLFNNGRAVETRAWRQAITIIYWCIDVASQLREIGFAAAFAGGGSRCLLNSGRLQAHLRRRAGRNNTPVNDFKRHRLAEPFVEAPVGLFKRAHNARDALAIQPTARKRNLYLMPLADVAYIRRALVPDLRGPNARLLQQRRTFRLHFAEQGIGLPPIKRIETPRPGAHEVEGERRGEKANRAHDARSKRGDQSGRPQRLRDAIAMHRPGPSEGKEGETMWILSALQCMDASGIRHAFIHNLVNAPGRLFER